MTAQAPNPRDFKSWEDAFQYPVPVVRRLEQQLRGSIDDNRDQLRRLVGTSYRDLLGTAERIIEMNESMRNADELLGKIGQKCNARTVEKIAVNHARTVKSQRDRNGQRNGLAATLTLLQSCMTVGGRIIKRGGSSLLVAKVLVLARLLHSSASKSQDPPPLLDTLRSRLASLRRRVLNHIDKILANPNVERSILVETLSAFSLATTSTPADVLRHFLNTRAEALTDLLEEPTEAGVHSAMSLLLSTLKDAHAVFPRRLADLLSRLQDEPLLQDDAVRNTPELNLDIYERWIADDVRNFTPYLRHDQLQASQATAVTRTWALNAKRTLLGGLKRLLEGLKDARRVMALRKDIVSRSLSADRKLPGLDQAVFFNDLRACFMDGLRGTATDLAHDLSVVVDKVLKDDHPAEGTNAVDIWDPLNTEIDLSRGAVDFRRLIINGSQGKDSRLQSLDISLTEWSSQMSGLSATIKSMKEDRWDDDFDLDLDEDLELNSPQDLLSKEDPSTLTKVMDEQKNQALAKVYDYVRKTVSEESQSSPKASFLLRLLREVVRHSASGEGAHSIGSKPPTALLDALYNQIAKHVLELSSAYRKPGKWIPFSRPPAITLWEGTPALPVQPSPVCFRFLHETCKAMKNIGSDLWTPGALDVLKVEMMEVIAASVEETVLKQAMIEEPTLPGDAPLSGIDADKVDEDPEEETKSVVPDGSVVEENMHQKTLQALYDALYLEKVLALTSSRDVDSFDKTLTQLKDNSKLEGAAVERLEKSSGDYYKRTYLLFGLLAI